MYSVLGVTGIGMNSIVACIIVYIVAYLMGNISPSILIGRARGIDIRSEGSGNAGTTNTLRVMGKGAAAAVLVIDILKGTIAVVLAGVFFGYHMADFAAFFVVMGHIWPVFFGFRGGKGVATAFGALMGISPLLGLSCLILVILVVLIFRKVSLGSIFGAISCPVFTWLFNQNFFFGGRYDIWHFFPVAVAFAVVICLKHHTNIKRLISGEESKLSFKKKDKEVDDE